MYHIKMIRKKDNNEYIENARYTLSKDTFRYWMKVHTGQGFVVRKISDSKIILKKREADNGLYFICEKEVA